MMSLLGALLTMVTHEFIPQYNFGDRWDSSGYVNVLHVHLHSTTGVVQVSSQC